MKCLAIYRWICLGWINRICRVEAKHLVATLLNLNGIAAGF